MPSFLSPMTREGAGPFGLVNQRNQARLADNLVGAFDSESRRTGLLKHTTFPEGEGLVIAPGSAIHMFFMKFPIDVAYVARDGRVLKVRHTLLPWRMSASLLAYAVVELPAGVLQRTDTRKGDYLTVVSAS